MFLLLRSHKPTGCLIRPSHCSPRDLSADRPDATESPITIDAGAVQLEINFFEFGRDSYNHSHKTVEARPSLVSNVKIGLTSDSDTEYKAIGSTGPTWTMGSDVVLDVGTRIVLN